MTTATPAVCPSHAALVAVIRSKSGTSRISLYDEKCSTDGTRRAILITRRGSFTVALSPSAFAFRAL